MRNKIIKYLQDFCVALGNIEVTKRGEVVDIDEGIRLCVGWLRQVKKTGSFVYLIGNGGSAAIASHQVTDFMKACGMKASSPMEHSLLTCMANDCGYEQVFSEPLKILMEKDDLLIAISSSGQSKNILKSTEVAAKKGCNIITMSGFKPDNHLRSKGDMNFYVPSCSYMFVESAHLFICNMFIDFTLESAKS